MYFETWSILNSINPKYASVIVTNFFSSFLSNTILFPCFELYARLVQWSEPISSTSMNLSTVNNSKSQQRGSSRSYIWINWITRLGYRYVQYLNITPDNGYLFILYLLYYRLLTILFTYFHSFILKLYQNTFM